MLDRDIWAIGVITYFLLCGYTPFDRESNLEEMQAILAADYSFTPIEYWRGVSLTAREFIKRCLTVNPTQRMTAHEALQHPWINQLDPNSPAYSQPTRGGQDNQDLLPVVKKNFNARRTLHKAIDTVRAINKLREGGGLMMDGAMSMDPRPKAENVEGSKVMSEHGSGVDSSDQARGPPDADAMEIDSRGDARGQTKDQIKAQERKIQEKVTGMWQSTRSR